MPETTSHEPKKFEYIQVLRFIAAFMVLVLHGGIFTQDRLDGSFQPYQSGANGVPLFFVISGFVMIVSSQKLLKAPEGWKTFAGKRILRIVPIYWLLTTVKVGLLLAGTGAIMHAKLDWIFIAKSYLFIPAFNPEHGLRPLLGVGWTLNYEMFFYLLFCLALYFRVRPAAFLTVTILPLFLGSFFRTDNWSALPDFYFDPVLLNFLFGVAGGTLIMKGKKMPKLLRYPSILVGLVVLFIPAENTGLTEIEFSLLYALMAFLVVFSAASVEKTGQQRVPRSLVYLGAASYSIYLVHPMIGPIVPTLMAKYHFFYPLLSVIGVIAVSLVGSVLFYRFIEVPLTGFLERIRKQRSIGFRDFLPLHRRLGIDVKNTPSAFANDGEGKSPRTEGQVTIIKKNRQYPV